MRQRRLFLLRGNMDNQPIRLLPASESCRGNEGFATDHHPAITAYGDMNRAFTMMDLRQYLMRCLNDDNDCRLLFFCT